MLSGILIKKSKDEQDAFGTSHQFAFGTSYEQEPLCKPHVDSSI